MRGDADRLPEHNERQGFEGDCPMANALLQVVESIRVGVQFSHGTLSGLPDTIERLKARAKMDSKANSPFGYMDRHGIIHLPFDEALELGRKFCVAEPSTVLVGVESTEREWEQKARRGEDYLVSLLNEFRASCAILRQWAGYDAAVAQRDADIQELERLAWDAIYVLQKAGLDSEAAKLRRAIEER